MKAIFLLSSIGNTNFHRFFISLDFIKLAGVIVEVESSDLGEVESLQESAAF